MSEIHDNCWTAVTMSQVPYPPTGYAYGPAQGYQPGILMKQYIHGDSWWIFSWIMSRQWISGLQLDY